MADNMIFEAYDDATRHLATEFENAGAVTGPMRQRLMESIEPDPLEGFVPSAQLQRGEKEY